MNRSVRSALAALAATATLALAGCASLPESGPVEQADDSGPRRADAGIRVLPEPPRAGASPNEVVEGFVQAMANDSPNYAVAKTYLTPQASAAWAPGRGVQVYADGARSENGVISGRLVGVVTPDGAFQGQRSNLSWDFKVVSTPEGPRISRPPAGVLISQYLFSQAYSRLNTYYFNPQGQTLVPDPVFVPRSSQLTDVVQALLRGPRGWVSPVVGTRWAPGTALVDRPSMDADGVVRVPLNGASARLGESDRRSMYAQFLWTLNQVQGFSRVELLVDGQPLTVDGRSSMALTDVDARWDSILGGRDPGGTPGAVSGDGREESARTQQGLYGVNGDKVVSIDEGGPAGGTPAVHEHAALPADADVKSLSPSWNSSGRRVAVVARGGRELWQLDSGRAPLTLRRGTAFLRPQYTRFTELFAMSGAPGQQRMYRFTRTDDVNQLQLREIGTPAFGGHEVVNFRISPDGMRMAAVRRVNGRLELGVALIDRRDNGLVLIDKWRAIAVTDASTGRGVTPLDVGWADDSRLLVLGVAPDASSTTPYLVDQDGASVTRLRSPSDWGANEIAVAPRYGGTSAVAWGNGPYRFVDEFTWTRLGDSVTAVAYPG